MSNQYSIENDDTLELVEQTKKNTNNPVVKSDHFADQTPVDASQIHEIPMGGTLASVGPLNGPVAGEILFFETPDQEIPMGGTVAAVGPMDETLVHTAPVEEK